MDEENVTTQDEQNVQDEAHEQDATTDVQEETPQEAPEEEAVVEESEEQEVVQEDTSEDSYNYQTPAPPQLQVADDGTLDVNQLNEWAAQVVQTAQQRSSIEVEKREREKAQWDRLYEKHPELKGDKKMRDVIHKQRMGTMLSGGKDDVMKAWDTIRELRDSGKKEGIKSQQESITRQKTANLETASTPNNNEATKSKNQELLDLSAARNRKVADQARQELLKGMIERGEV